MMQRRGRGYPLGNLHRACALCAGIHWHDLGDEMTRNTIEAITAAWLVVATAIIGINIIMAAVLYIKEWMQ